MQLSEKIRVVPFLESVLKEGRLELRVAHLLERVHALPGAVELRDRELLKSPEALPTRKPPDERQHMPDDEVAGPEFHSDEVYHAPWEQGHDRPCKPGRLDGSLKNMTGSADQRLHAIISRILENDTIRCEPETLVRQVPGWNSMNNVRIMVAIEKDFGIRLSAPEVVRVRTYGDLVALLESKIAGRRS